MLQAYNTPESAQHEDQGLDLNYFIGLLKRRFLYLVIPFLIVAILGASVVVVQRSIYRAVGVILVEAPEIPTDLVRPTVTQVADQRIRVIAERIMSRDNLLAVTNKLKLFPTQQKYMSGTELLDLVRDRITIEPYDPDAAAAEKRKKEGSTTAAPPRNNNKTPTIAFTLSFDYEVPNLAMLSANEFLTSLLSEDAQKRARDAAETTKFLDREMKRLQAEHDSLDAQLAAIKQRPPDPTKTNADQVKLQMATLTGLQAELIEKSSIYSDEHPQVKSLKKRVAELQHLIANGPQSSSTSDAPSVDVATEVLGRQQVEIEKRLDEASRKVTSARLGESMERDQQSERLEVVEQPSIPQEPVRPKKLKWFAVAFALAGMAGGGAAFAAEILDGSIRGSSELAGTFGSHLIVTIPYLSTVAEERRKRLKLILWATFVAILGAVLAAVLIFGIPTAWFDGSPLADTLTHLAK